MAKDICIAFPFLMNIYQGKVPESTKLAESRIKLLVGRGSDIHSPLIHITDRSKFDYGSIAYGMVCKISNRNRIQYILRA